jgi:hypothetical protein
MSSKANVWLHENANGLFIAGDNQNLLVLAQELCATDYSRSLFIVLQM